MNDDNMITFMDAMLYAMEGESPSKAIENQERRGQQSVVRNRLLPKKVNDYYEKMGITIYDRNAFIRFNTRFRIEVAHVADADSEEILMRIGIKCVW